MKHIYTFILLATAITVHATNQSLRSMIHHNVDSKEIIERLKNENLGVNALVDSDGNTSLHYACKYSRTKLVEALIENGANVNAQNSPAAWTPLHKAAFWGHYNIVNILLQSGANKENRTCCDNETPADFARKYGYPGIAELIDNYEYIEDIKEPECD